MIDNYPDKAKIPITIRIVFYLGVILVAYILLKYFFTFSR